MNEWMSLKEVESSCLKTNRHALQEFHPHLANRIEPLLQNQAIQIRKHEDGYIDVSDNGEVILDAQAVRAHRSRCVMQIAQLSALYKPALIYCIGFDAGFSFLPLYQHIRPSDRKFLLVVEPDIRMLAAGLAACDLAQALSSRQIFWVFGNGWEADVMETVERNHLFSLQSVEVYHGNFHNLRSNIASRLQAVSQNAALHGKKALESELAEAQAYYLQKTPDRIERILAMEIRGGMAVRFIQSRFLDECRTLGIDVQYFESGVLGGISLIRTICRMRPDMVLFMNWHPAEYVPIQILNQLRLPRVTWCIDDPYSFLKDKHRFGQHDFIWTWDTAYEDCFTARQALSIDHVPYVADFDKIESSFQERFASPVSYVGQVGVLNPNELKLDEATTRLVQKVGKEKARQLYRSYASLTLEFQDEFGLKIIEREEQELPPNIRYGMYVAGNAQRRIDVLERAMPFGLKLYGNDAWKTVLDGHALLDCYKGPADPQNDVPHIFRSSRINLNIHSIQALTSLNQRDFNCPLSGGFLLTDWVEGCEDSFEPDRQLVFYRGLNDLESKIRYYLDRPEERDAIIQNGKARVLRDHTYFTLVPRTLDRLRERIRERYCQ